MVVSSLFAWFANLIGLVATNDAATVPPYSVNGTWSPVGAWPLSPVHMILLKNGKVLTYGQGGPVSMNGDSADPNLFYYDVWDPSLGLDNPSSHHTLPTQTGTDIFCSGQVNIPGLEGEVLIMGGSQVFNGVKNSGTTHTQIFNATSETLYLTGNNMYHARWYPSVTVLDDGNIVVQVSSLPEHRSEVNLVPCSISQVCRLSNDHREEWTNFEIQLSLPSSITPKRKSGSVYPMRRIRFCTRMDGTILVRFFLAKANWSYFVQIQMKFGLLIRAVRVPRLSLGQCQENHFFDQLQQ
jgi:hypothetical protein